MEREFITMEDFMKKGKFITNEDFGNAAARAMNDDPMAELLKDEPMLTLLLATFTEDGDNHDDQQS